MSPISGPFLKTLALMMILVLAAGGYAGAHFVLDAQARLIHIVRADQTSAPSSMLPASATPQEGLRLLIRIPAPLAYAEALSQRSGAQDRVEAPYLKETTVQGALFYTLDRAAIEKDPAGFAAFIVDGYRVTQSGAELTLVPLRSAVHANRDRPHFNDLDGALISFETPTVGSGEDPYVGDSVIDIDLWVPDASPSANVSIQSALPVIALPAGVHLENLGFDHRFGTVRPVSASGQLSQPLHFDGSLVSSFMRYVWQGMVHIFVGIDHVLFVVCLALAAGWSIRILWAVTGFTIGHSITLALGTLGFEPHGAWFPPAIELTIALSIVLVAALVLRDTWRTGGRRLQTNGQLFALTGLIGLLHGYGFSFVFTDLLGGSAHRITVALAGFNVGVELGQLLIVLAVLAVLAAIARISAPSPKWVSSAIAAGAIVVAGVWVVERSLLLQSTLAPSL